MAASSRWFAAENGAEAIRAQETNQTPPSPTKQGIGDRKENEFPNQATLAGKSSRFLKASKWGGTGVSGARNRLLLSTMLPQENRERQRPKAPGRSLPHESGKNSR